MNEPILYLKSLSEYYVKNRGQVYRVDLPDEFLKQYHKDGIELLKALTENIVNIDGKDYKVLAVERYAVNQWMNFNVGLLVEEYAKH